jgi:hypothetical protein
MVRYGHRTHFRANDSLSYHALAPHVEHIVLHFAFRTSYPKTSPKKFQTNTTIVDSPKFSLPLFLLCRYVNPVPSRAYFLRLPFKVKLAILC